MHHRHLRHRRFTLAALDDILENGTLADWQPVLALVRRDPHGLVASRIAELLAARDYEETGALWTDYLERARLRVPVAATGDSVEAAAGSSER